MAVIIYSVRTAEPTNLAFVWKRSAISATVVVICGLSMGAEL